MSESHMSLPIPGPSWRPILATDPLPSPPPVPSPPSPIPPPDPGEPRINLVFTLEDENDDTILRVSAALAVSQIRPTIERLKEWIPSAVRVSFDMV
jgi:hypothetical protein